MRKYILIIFIFFSPAILYAQIIDTVKQKLAKIPYIKCEIHPSLKSEKIENYIAHNLTRPQNISSHSGGDVLVSLLIDTTGTPTNIQIIKSQSKGIDDNIKRMLSATKWEPAIYNFKNIDYFLILHIVLKID